MRRIPSTSVTRAKELAELGANARSEVSPPRIDVLAEQRDLTHAPLRELRNLGDDLAGPAALLPTSNCRDDAVRALRVAAHGHLHPSLEPPLGTPGQVGRKVLVGAELPARNGEPTRGDPLAEVRDGARAEGDVHERDTARRSAPAAPPRNTHPPRPRDRAGPACEPPRCRGARRAACPAFRAPCRC